MVVRPFQNSGVGESRVAHTSKSDMRSLETLLCRRAVTARGRVEVKLALGA
jgi:hypothetical protein